MRMRFKGIMIMKLWRMKKERRTKKIRDRNKLMMLCINFRKLKKDRKVMILIGKMLIHTMTLWKVHKSLKITLQIELKDRKDKVKIKRKKLKKRRLRKRLRCLKSKKLKKKRKAFMLKRKLMNLNSI